MWFSKIQMVVLSDVQRIAQTTETLIDPPGYSKRTHQQHDNFNG